MYYPRGGVEFFISLEPTEPAREGTRWRFSLIAIVGDHERRPPEPPVEVEFFLDGVSSGGGQTDLSTGRAQVEIDVPETPVVDRRYRAQAQILGTSYTSPARTILIQATKPKLPKSILVHKSQVTRGRWQFFVQVLDENQRPVQGVVARTLPLVNLAAIPDTDSHGETNFEVQVSEVEPQKFFRIVVAGTDIWVREQVFYLN